MDDKKTRHQVARGAFPDAQAHDALVIYKNVSLLRATYQIRLLIYMSLQRGLKLRILVPKATKLHPALANYATGEAREHMHVP